jgi:hypothetical protein
VGAGRRPPVAGAAAGLFACLGLAACTPPAEGPEGSLRERQVAACAAVTAEHLGRPGTDLTAAWLGTTPAGTALVELPDPARPHVCEVDAAARVLRLDHLGREPPDA